MKNDEPKRAAILCRAFLRSVGTLFPRCVLFVCVAGAYASVWAHPAVSASHSAGDTFSGEVSSVIDGDSIMVKKDHQKIEARLWGIDAPEFDQPFGAAAKKALASLVLKSNLVFEVMDVDRYGRLVVIARQGAMNVNEAMIRDGYAWVHIRYCLKPPCQRWFAREKQARRQRLGIWHDDDPVAPWEWKRNRLPRNTN